jgi:hypothetical protein
MICYLLIANCQLPTANFYHKTPNYETYTKDTSLALFTSDSDSTANAGNKPVHTEPDDDKPELCG